MAPPTGQLPIFVISLARAGERRQRIVEHLKSLGLQHTVVEAVDGSALPADRQQALLAPGQRYHAGVIGCYLSHLAVYQAIVDGGIPAALVLEDDARLHPGVRQLLHAPCAPDSYDYCFLDSDDHNDEGPVFYDRDDARELSPGIQAYRLSAGPQTLHAYLISNAGATKRLAHALPIELPIDLYRQLPYPITFRAVVQPKLAWVSGDSLTSFTSERKDDPAALRFAVLRRSPWFYRVRDWLRFKPLRARRLVRDAVGDGRLPPGRRWLPLPSGREVVL